MVETTNVLSDARRKTDTILFDSLEEQGKELNELRVEFGKVETNQRSIFSVLNTLSDKVEQLGNKIGESAKPQLGIWISFASLIITVIALLAAGFIGIPQREMKSTQLELRDIVVEHVRDGHPKVVMELLGSRIEHLEIEQDVLNKLIRTIENYLYEHNGEAKAVIADYKATKNTMTEKVNALEQTDIKQASYEERLRSLERKTFPPTSYRDGRPGG